MTIPAAIVEAWREQAIRNAERQMRHHDAQGHAQPYDECWKCGKQRAVCKSKIRFETIDAVTEACADLNHPTRDRLVTPYRCHWSEGLHWHMATATTSANRRTARKRMARAAR